MRWMHLAVQGEMGLASVACSICGVAETDLIWYPTDWDTREAEQLKVWIGTKGDPYEKIKACGTCHAEIVDLLRSYKGERPESE